MDTTEQNSAVQTALTPEQKKQKATNRFFGLFLILDIVLGVLIIASVITVILANK